MDQDSIAIAAIFGQHTAGALLGAGIPDPKET